MKRRFMILGLAVVSMGTGASGATWYAQYREFVRLDGKLMHHAALTVHECSLLTESQRIAFAMKNPMHPDVPCTAGI